MLSTELCREQLFSAETFPRKNILYRTLIRLKRSQCPWGNISSVLFPKKCVFGGALFKVFIAYLFPEHMLSILLFPGNDFSKHNFSKKIFSKELFRKESYISRILSRQSIINKTLSAVNVLSSELSFQE